MNLLAHIYLSGSNEEILIGNFMGDHIKGKAYLNFPAQIQKGILLHRKIDYFTDHHPITKQCKALVSEKYGKYSGIIIDLFFDYILASQWGKFSSTDLNEYIEHIFSVLNRYQHYFSGDMQKWYPKMIQNNWLLLYSSIEGIERIIRGMSNHSSLPDYTEYAIEILKSNEKQLSQNFENFFMEIQQLVKEEFNITPEMEAISLLK